MKDTTKGKVIIVVGGAYGSESKGLFCSHLALKENVEYSVRTGSINAGHTVFYNGKAYKNQQIPVAWINPNTTLIIGAGAYVHPEILDAEIKMVEEALGESISTRLVIDQRAGAHLPKHRNASEGRHEKMGTVGEGVSAAIVERLRREEGAMLFKDTDYCKENAGKKFVLADTVGILNDGYDRGLKILIEGTQGTLLDVYLGPWPDTTSRQTIAASWMAECGLSPNLNTEIALVCRTYPIRVAGNSGPMPRETSWWKLAKNINLRREAQGYTPLIKESSLNAFKSTEISVAEEWGLPNAYFETWSPEDRKKYSKELVNIHKEVFSRLPQEVNEDLFKVFETTTVTKKLRRIAELDMEMLNYSIEINRPDYLVLFFLNYAFPTLWDVDKVEDCAEKDQIYGYITDIEDATGVPINYINWRPNQVIEI